MDDASAVAGADTGEQVALVLLVVLVVVFVGWLKRRFVQRRAYLDAVAAFRWNPDMSPVAFEQHCADFLSMRGWKARTTKGSGDQGVDVLAEKSGVRIVLQCKKYSRPVGNKAVQEAHAAKDFARANRAAVVSNMGYTRGACELARGTGVLLLHFTDLANADRLFGLANRGAGQGASADASLGHPSPPDVRNRVPCPRCKAILRLPRGRSGTVRCPECSHRLDART